MGVERIGTAGQEQYGLIGHGSVQIGRSGEDQLAGARRGLVWQARNGKMGTGQVRLGRYGGESHGAAWHVLARQALTGTGGKAGYGRRGMKR